MAYDINTVVLIGRLTRDGELSYTQNTNKALYRFSIANNTGRSDSPDSVSYFDVIIWDKMAEICNQYLSKGSQVVVNGRLVQNRFQDQQGQQRSRIEIVANTVQFVGAQGSGASDRNNSVGDYQSQGNIKKDSSTFDEDDIPF